MKQYLVFLFIFLAGCASKKKIAEFEAQPDWVKQKPIVSGYYIGVGSVNKIGTSAQYIAKARQEALTDLAEGVSSNVSATSVLHSIETEYGYSESYNQKIQISTDDYLEGFDPVDAYETESMYWVYYKIAKSTYLEMKEKKKQEAIATALAKYESGLQEQTANKPKEAIAFYLQGLQAIKRYLNEETPTQFKGNMIDVGNNLYSSTNEVLNSLSIESRINEIVVKRGKSFENNIEFTIRFNNKPVQGIPVEYSYTGGYLKKDKQSSDANGNTELEPEVLYSRNGKEQITATINLKEIAQKAVDDLFIRGLILKRNLKPAIIQVKIEAPSIAFQIRENSCTGEECSRITNLFNQNAKQSGYEITSIKNADYIFMLFYGYKQGESAGGLTSVIISGELTIESNTGRIIWAKQTEDIKGVGATLNDAKGKAFNDFYTALDRKFFKQGFDNIK